MMEAIGKFEGKQSIIPEDCEETSPQCLVELLDLVEVPG